MAKDLTGEKGDLRRGRGKKILQGEGEMGKEMLGGEKGGKDLQGGGRGEEDLRGKDVIRGEGGERP